MFINDTIEENKIHDLDMLTSEELAIYKIRCEEFMNGETWKNTKHQCVKDSLLHQYGIRGVKIYNRPYNKRKRQLAEYEK